MAKSSRVLIDLSPTLLATALARVLSGLGYEVVVGDGGGEADVAVVSERSDNRCPVVIALPRLEGGGTTAVVSSGGSIRRVPMRHLRDLLDVIEGA